MKKKMLKKIQKRGGFIDCGITVILLILWCGTELTGQEEFGKKVLRCEKPLVDILTDLV